MNDRRRINGPLSGTTPPIFSRNTQNNAVNASERPSRTRRPNTLRKMFLKTGVTPSASGSAYLELESRANSRSNPPTLATRTSSDLKLTCTVHGPRPLPRSAPFSPHIILTTYVKYAPFASRQRRGYVRDTSEQDLAVHLETALRGVIIGDRWPKSGVEVIITILEGEDGCDLGNGPGVAQKFGSTGAGQWEMMSVLSGCITVASAAIADAGIDCVDMVSGGVAAITREHLTSPDDSEAASPISMVLDPVPSEHMEILAACVVGYLPSRDEITNVWIKGRLGNAVRGEHDKDISTYDELADNAVQAALGSHRVLAAAIKESANIRLKR